MSSNQQPKLVAKATIQAQRAAFAQRLLLKQHELENARASVRDIEQTVEQLRGALQGLDSILAAPDYALPTETKAATEPS